MATDLLFDLPPQVPAPAPMAPAHPVEYSLQGFDQLLKAAGISLAQAAAHPGAMAFLRRRESVLAGTWPIYVHEERHECDCDQCKCEDVELTWRCPVCACNLHSFEDLGAMWDGTCDRQHLEHRTRGNTCGAEFEARELDGKWRLFLLPKQEDPS